MEVKSGKDYKIHNALNNVLSMNEYNIKEAYILSNENLSVNQNKVYIPVYMAMFLKNKKPDIGVYKIDLTALTGWKS